MTARKSAAADVHAVVMALASIRDADPAAFKAWQRLIKHLAKRSRG